MVSAPRQTVRLLVVGKSGSGKTSLAKRIIRRMLQDRRCSRLIVINRKRELSEFCEASYRVSETGNAMAALKRHRRVHFYITGYDPRPFLDELGAALMQLRGVLLVADEMHFFFPKGQLSKGLLEAITVGRDLGLNFIGITQMLKNAQGAIDPVLRKQASHLIVFRMTDPSEVAEVAGHFDELGPRVATLARPDDGLPPEYGVKNLDTGQSGVVLRDPGDPRRQIWRPLS